MVGVENYPEPCGSEVGHITTTPQDGNSPKGIPKGSTVYRVLYLLIEIIIQHIFITFITLQIHNSVFTIISINYKKRFLFNLFQ